MKTMVGPRERVTEAALDHLPATARRYMRFMGVIGRPLDESFRVDWTGRFRPSPGKPWMRCAAWQYNTGHEIARVFQMRLQKGGIDPLSGRDTYVNGHGRLVVRMFHLLDVVDRSGIEMDVSELVTWLAEAVLFAPSMLLDANVSWTPASDEAFDLTLEDHGIRVSARVVVDERGAPHTFRTTDRFCEDPARPRTLVRARWTSTVHGWLTVQGRPVPARVRATWDLPQGEFSYAELQVVSNTLAWNTPYGRKGESHETRHADLQVVGAPGDHGGRLHRVLRHREAVAPSLGRDHR